MEVPVNHICGQSPIALDPAPIHSMKQALAKEAYNGLKVGERRWYPHLSDGNSVREQGPFFKSNHDQAGPTANNGRC